LIAGTSSSGRRDMSSDSLAGEPNPCQSTIGGLDTWGGMRSVAGTFPSCVLTTRNSRAFRTHSFCSVDAAPLDAACACGCDASRRHRIVVETTNSRSLHAISILPAPQRQPGFWCTILRQPVKSCADTLRSPRNSRPSSGNLPHVQPSPRTAVSSRQEHGLPRVSKYVSSRTMRP